MKLDYSKIILVIGDSHVRSFSENCNFFPLFLGAGKEYCFVTDEHLERIILKMEEVLVNIPDKTKIILLFGEPDTRFYLGKGWTPWNQEGEDDLENYEEKIDSSYLRYSKLISHLLGKFNMSFVISMIPYSERINQNILVDYFNSRLKYFVHQNKLDFIDIKDELFNGNRINTKFMGDVVHYSNLIQPIVENHLINQGFITKSGFNSKTDWDNKQIQSQYEFNQQFGCFIKK